MSDPVFDTILRNLNAKRLFHESEAAKLVTAIDAIEALSEPVSMKGSPLARGFDRDLISAKCRKLKITYPLARSYSGNSGPANFSRQAIVSHVQMHPRYQEWLDKENVTGMDNPHRNRDKLEEACAFLGLNYDALKLEARILHKEILAHGTHGIDYRGA